VSQLPTESHPSPLAEFLAADKATRAAAATVDQWLEVYRRAAGETLTQPLLDLLLRDALEAISRIVRADAVSLLLANPEGSALVSRAAFGLGREVELSLSIPAGSGVSGSILATGEPLIVDDLRTVELMSDLLLREGHRSLVGVPLSVAGRCFGVLHATSSQIGAFHREDAELLLRFAEPIAAAIDRVRLFDSERMAREMAELATERVRSLLRITTGLVRAITVNEVCEIIINEAVPETIRVGERAIWMLRDARLVLMAGTGDSASYPEIPLDPSLPAAEILLSGEPLFVETRAELGQRWPVLAAGPTSSFAVIPLAIDGQRLGVMAIGFQDEHRFARDEVDFLTALAEQASVALARTEGREALLAARITAETQRARLDFLADASTRLSASLDLSVTLEVVADLATPRLTDRCELFLLDDGTIARRVLVPNLLADEQQLSAEFLATYTETGGIGAVLRSGQSLFVEDLDDSSSTAGANAPEYVTSLQAAGFGGFLVSPLRTRGRTLGALAFFNQKGRAITTEDRILAEALSSRAALAIDNALLYETESHIATQLAASLLPARLPNIEGLEIAVRYKAGSSGLDVGGDFYDVFACGDATFDVASVLVLIGDVQGKGVEAAAVTGLARHTVRASAKYETSPAALLRRLNDAINVNIEESSAKGAYSRAEARLCTAAIIRFDRADSGWVATTSTAGHPLPLVRRADGSVINACEPGLLLGVADTPTYQETIVNLRPDETIVLYTDGVSERHADGEMFGTEGIARVLKESTGPAPLVAEAIVDAAMGYSTRREDDLVVLTIRAL
jgi:GAF domain-containing protein